MISRITLPKQLRAELAENRLCLVGVLARSTKDKARNAALETERARLERAIEKLESADTLNESDASKLAMRREQLRRVQQSISDISDKPASAKDFAEMRGGLMKFRQLLHRALAPLQDEIFNEIARSIKKYFTDSNALAAIIPQSDPMRNYGNFMSRAWCLDLASNRNPYILAAEGATLAIKMLIDRHRELHEQALKNIQSSRDLAQAMRDAGEHAARDNAQHVADLAEHFRRLGENVDRARLAIQRTPLKPFSAFDSK